VIRVWGYDDGPNALWWCSDAETRREPMPDNKHPTTPPPAQPAKPAEPATPTRSPYEAKPNPLPPVGSRDYVAGQPIDEEEQRKVDGEHEAKLKAAQEEARKAEQKAADTHSKK
jgi:hypothetical protein